MSELKELFGEYMFADVQDYKNLSIVPIKTEKKSDIEYILLKDALDKNQIDIIETSIVNKLTIRKNMPENLLVLKGDYVVGGKQNRVVSVNGLIEKKEIDIPVHCIQHGRWGYGNGYDGDIRIPRIPRMPRRDPNSPWNRPGYPDEINIEIERPWHGVDYDEDNTNFYIGKSFAACSLRNDISKDSAGGSGQSKTWNKISSISNLVGAHSFTGDYDEVINAKKKDIDEYMKNFKYIDGQNGIMVKIGDGIFTDYFDKPETFKKQYERLMSSYIIDSLAFKEKKSEKITAKDGAKFMQDLLSTKAEVSKSLDLGEDYELRNGINGSALVYNSTVIYLGAKK